MRIRTLVSGTSSMCPVNSHSQGGRVLDTTQLFALFALLVGCALPLAAAAQPEFEGPQLDVDITQAEIEARTHTLNTLRSAGRRVFSTPFNKADGHGDGPMDPSDPTALGGRPTLQDNGTFLRFNGLDSQTCLECHSILSNRTIPATFGVGGAGSASANAFPGVVAPDIADTANNGFAAISGRIINPPILLGAGGIELVGKEMTTDLQDLLDHALDHPNVVISLDAKGVNFGTLVCDEAGACDMSNVQGLEEDLVVRPFGRKGEFISTRQFDQGALQFHLGMQPVEIVELLGRGPDPDGDGVENEITVGQLSLLSIFITTLERPIQLQPNGKARNGERLFDEIGCADCHVPMLKTQSRTLGLAFPEIGHDPSANVYYSMNLSKKPTGFDRSGSGLRVPMFADLKRHDMGEALAESTGSDLASMFTTARLWGVADSAPYLHDGRALTISAAILLHGGEAEASAAAFDNLSDTDIEAVLAFLNTLRNPSKVGRDLD